MAVTDLHRSETLRVRHVPAGDGTRCVVTFDHYGIGPGLDRPGFAEAFLRASGVSAVHVMGRGDDWYQYADLFAALEAARAAAAAARRVVAYGSSMGGYAAARFADRVGAHAALAISPQWSIDPTRNDFDARWLAEGRRLTFLPEIEAAASPRARPVVVFDRAGPDRAHAERIDQEMGAILVGVAHLHHPATTALLEMGVLADLVLDMTRGEIDARALRRAVRHGRRRSPTALSLMASRLPPRRAPAARALQEAALALAPHNPVALTAVADWYDARGEHLEALARRELAVAASDRAPGMLVPLSQTLAALGRHEDASAVAAEAADLMPTAAHVQFWRGWTAGLAGRTDEALAAMRRAVALDPGDAHHREALARLEADLAQPQ